MNKEVQDFLDRSPQTTIELAAQRLLSSHTKTHLLQLERSFRNLDKALYTTSMKQLTITELFAALTYAKALLCDTQPTESSSTSTQEK